MDEEPEIGNDLLQRRVPAGELFAGDDGGRVT